MKVKNPVIWMDNTCLLCESPVPLELTKQMVEFKWQGAILHAEQTYLHCVPCHMNFVTPDLWDENEKSFEKTKQYLEHILDGGCP